MTRGVISAFKTGAENRGHSKHNPRSYSYCAINNQRSSFSRCTDIWRRISSYRHVDLHPRQVAPAVSGRHFLWKTGQIRIRAYHKQGKHLALRDQQPWLSAHAPSPLSKPGRGACVVVVAPCCGPCGCPVAAGPWQVPCPGHGHGCSSRAKSEDPWMGFQALPLLPSLSPW